MKEAAPELSETELLDQLTELINNGQPIPKERRFYVVSKLRLALSEQKKPRRAPHRPRSWKTVDALLMFGWKVVHEKKSKTDAYHEIAKAFGLEDSKSVSDHPEFKAQREMILESFRGAHFHPRKPKK